MVKLFRLAKMSFQGRKIFDILTNMNGFPQETGESFEQASNA